MASNINQIKRSALVYVKDIGRGAFSTVYQMTWQSPDGPINVAAKKLNSKDKHELEVLSGLHHPNILQLIGVVHEETDFMLVLELCEGGSLRSYIKARNGRRLPAKQFYDWAEQAGRPLEYLRENHLVHKDVKSPNYMVTSQKTLKLGDFGLAKNIEETIDNATTTASYPWMAPELLKKHVLSPKYDIFALAVVLWELWTGSFPWEGLESPTIMWKVCNENKRLPIPEDSPKPFKDLLRQCWEAEWKLRPDIIQLLQVITSLAVEVRQRKIIAGPWNFVNEFDLKDGPNKLEWVSCMALSPDGDVVIVDSGASQIKTYSLEGECKSSIDTQYKPHQIAISSDNTYFITNLNRSISMYKSSGQFKGSWVASCPDASLPAPKLYCLAMDHAGDLLLGDIENEYIYKHREDGTHVASIKVGIQPWYIAATSKGTIVLSEGNTAPQVINTTGDVLNTLELPVGESDWITCNVYCHQGIIFICNLSRFGILCYSESGKYLGSMPTIPFLEWFSVTSDGNTLVVCDPGSNGSIQVLRYFGD